jgi:hypothetical protein
MTQIEIDQRVFDLYDEYCHGRMDRREFLERAAFRPAARPERCAAVWCNPMGRGRFLPLSSSTRIAVLTPTSRT